MRFMGPMPGAGQTMTFDVGALRGALPLVSAAPAPAASGWAADFARAAGGVAAPSVAGTGAEWALQMQAQSGIERAGTCRVSVLRWYSTFASCIACTNAENGWYAHLDSG